MKINITSRDVKFYILGILTMFLVATIYDWDKNLEAFKRGFNYDEKNHSELKN